MAAPAATVVNDKMKYSAIAAADMLDKRNRFVKWSQAASPAQDNLGFTLCGVADEPDGINQEEPTAGYASPVDTIGRVLLRLGGTVAAFTEVVPDATGRGVAVPTGGAGYAMTLKAGVEGDTVDVIWLGNRRKVGGIELNAADDAFNRHALLHKVTIGAGADVATLAAGLYVGQEKHIRCTEDGGGTYEITGAFLTNATATTTATFNDVGDHLHLMWDGAAWFVLTNTSVTLA